MIDQALNLITEFANTHIYFFYVIFYIFCVLSGLGFPISSDLLFLGVSYLVFSGKADFTLCSLLGIAGILTGDMIMHTLGRKSTELKLLKNKKEWLSRGNKLIEKYGATAVFMARFFPGIRTVIMFSAGLLQVKRRYFIIADLLGAMIVIPSLLYSVTYFAGQMEPLKAAISQAQSVAYVLILVALVIISFTFYLIKSKTPK